MLHSELKWEITVYKYIAFIVGGLFAGVAGVLFGSFSGILVPTHLGVLTSNLTMLMVVLGSSSITFGPLLGAALVMMIEHVSSICAPERWPIILGCIFIIAVMFLRGGVGIHLSSLWEKVSCGRYLVEALRVEGLSQESLRFRRGNLHNMPV